MTIIATKMLVAVCALVPRSDAKSLSNSGINQSCRGLSRAGDVEWEPHTAPTLIHVIVSKAHIKRPENIDGKATSLLCTRARRLLRGAKQRALRIRRRLEALKAPSQVPRDLRKERGVRRLQEIGKLYARILCEKHNSGLSDFDQTFIDMMLGY